MELENETSAGRNVIYSTTLFSSCMPGVYRPLTIVMFRDPSIPNAMSTTCHSLLTTTEPEHQVQGRLLLNVVVAEGPAVLELLAGKDEALLIRGDALLVLNL
jgi:hypothetical protein